LTLCSYPQSHSASLLVWRGSYDYVIPDELDVHDLEDEHSGVAVALWYQLEENWEHTQQLENASCGFRRVLLAKLSKPPMP
jgi:hypothetical protein